MRRQGFTLVEMVIALNVMLILVGTMLFSFGQAARSWKKIARRVERLQVENIIAERICREVRSAAEILPDSGSTEVSLRIGSEIIQYSLNNGKVRRKSGRFVTYLTDENEIERLTFTCPAKNLVEVRLDNLVFQAAIRN